MFLNPNDPNSIIELVDDNGVGSNEELIFSTSIGAQYFIKIDSLVSVNGVYSVTIE